MMPNVLQASSTVLEQLANPAARALALGVAAGFGLAAFRVRATSARLFTWTTVLYAALAMPLLGWILPPVQISMPTFLQGALFQHQLQQPASSSTRVFASTTSTGRIEPARSTATKKVARLPISQAISASGPTPMRERSQSPLSSIPWSIVAAAIYLAVFSLLIIRFFIGVAFGRRLIRASHAIEEERVSTKTTECAATAGLGSVPETLESEFISVPVTMGVLRPTILLPTTWCEWDDAKLDAVIAHEMSHVARRDALTQGLSLLYRAIFWFSPLAWWLDRRLADLAEQASDEAALACGTDRKHYAQILLGFFETLHTSPGRVWWQGVSMAKAGQAEERLERILASKGSVAMHLKKSIAIAVIAFAIPTVYLVASTHSASRVVATTAIAQSPTSPVAAAPASNLAPKVAPTQIRGTIEGGTAAISQPSLAPEEGVVSVIDPAAVVAPVAAEPEVQEHYSHSSHSSGNNYFYRYVNDDDQRFVIVTGNSDSLMMSVSTADARHVEKLRKSIPGDFIWFQSDEKSYVIRDQATIDRARKLWAPQEELGKKQEALGKQQEALGKQQEALGKKMEEIHVKVPDMTADLDKLKAELKQLTSSATMDQVGKIQSEIGELQSKIGDLQSHAGEQQGKLGEEMGALGEQQGKLGEEQGKLGEQQARLAEEATRQMKVLFEEAIKKGTAQPEI